MRVAQNRTIVESHSRALSGSDLHDNDAIRNAADEVEMASQSVDVFDTSDLVPGFRPPPQPGLAASQPAIDAATHNSRSWHSKLPGKLEPGSEQHRNEVCRMFRDTFNPYRPAVLDWPRLDAQTLRRIVSLPIWDIAVQTEGKARLRMAAYASTLADPAMRDALALNAWEENRHKEVLSRMVEAYGIALAPESEYAYPRDPEWAYLVTGYSECIDSFFAFGLFEAARRSGLFPPELVDTFEPVMQEECRHILLFANWATWHRAHLPWWRRLQFEAKVLAVWAFLGWERLGIARSIDADGKESAQDNNFTVNGAQAVTDGGIDVPALIKLCLQENDRRFAGYDPRLLRPTTVPRLARLALKFLDRRRASKA